MLDFLESKKKTIKVTKTRSSKPGRFCALVLIFQFVPVVGFNANAGSLRIAYDVSSRSIHDVEEETSAASHTLGLDLQKVISNRHRDIATIVFQPYWMQLRDVEDPPGFFEDGDDAALNWRIANINWRLRGDGKMNFRVGHFEVPFGLEQNLDTNGTLRQFTFAERGIKADWGLSVNGLTDAIEYEFSLTRASGNDWESEGQRYLAAGRVGNTTTKNLVYGLSYFYGDFEQPGIIQQRYRVGVDLAYYYRQWQVSFELSGGENEDEDRRNTFMELAWRAPFERLLVYGQWQSTRRSSQLEEARDDDLSLGVKWQATRKIDLSAQWQELQRDSGDRDPTALLQVRARL